MYLGTPAILLLLPQEQTFVGEQSRAVPSMDIQAGIRTAIPSFACRQYRPFPVRPREILAPRQLSKITATLEQLSAKRPSQMMAALGPVLRIGLKPQADWFIRAASA